MSHGVTVLTPPTREIEELLGRGGANPRHRGVQSPETLGSVPQKTCQVCRALKPLADFAWREIRKKGQRNLLRVLSSLCHECRGLTKRQRRLKARAVL